MCTSLYDSINLDDVIGNFLDGKDIVKLMSYPKKGVNRSMKPGLYATTLAAHQIGEIDQVKYIGKKKSDVLLFGILMFYSRKLPEEDQKLIKFELLNKYSEEKSWLGTFLTSKENFEVLIKVSFYNTNDLFGFLGEKLKELEKKTISSYFKIIYVDRKPPKRRVARRGHTDQGSRRFPHQWVEQIGNDVFYQEEVEKRQLEKEQKKREQIDTVLIGFSCKTTIGWKDLL